MQNKLRAEEMIENTLQKRDIFLETNAYQPHLGDISVLNSDEYRGFID